jgi:hypothetical protein
MRSTYLYHQHPPHPPYLNYCTPGCHSYQAMNAACSVPPIRSNEYIDNINTNAVKKWY